MDGDFYTNGELSLYNLTGGEYNAKLTPGSMIEILAYPETVFKFVGWKVDIENDGNFYPDGKPNPRYKDVIASSEEQKLSPSPVFEQVNYNLEVIISLPGELGTSLPPLAGNGEEDFSEMVEGNTEEFRGVSFTGLVQSGAPYDVSPKHVEGYQYHVYQWGPVNFQFPQDGYIQEIGDQPPMPSDEVMMGWVYRGSELFMLLRSASPALVSRSLIGGTAGQDERYLVLYEPLHYEIEFGVLDSSIGKGSVDPSGTDTYAFDDEIKVTATPNSGYQFVQWWGEFRVKMVDIGEEEFAVSRQESEFESYTTELRPIKDMSGNPGTLVVDGSIMTLDSDPDPLEQEMYPLEIFDNGMPTRIFAEFRNRPTITTAEVYTLTVSSTDGGSVASGEGTTTYNSIQTFTLDPRADAGYEFVGWTGPDANKVVNNVITVDGKYSVIANFELVVIPEPTPQEPVTISEPEPIVPEPVPVVEEVILDEATAEDVPEALPATGGIPSEGFSLLGIALTAVGAKLRKKI
jgi:uncharacterized repeat protein (TIGR02543 family)